MKDGKNYWLLQNISTRTSLAVDLKYKLKQLGPSVQDLFTDEFYRRQAVSKVKILRQCITQDPFEHPSDSLTVTVHSPP